MRTTVDRQPAAFAQFLVSFLAINGAAGRVRQENRIGRRDRGRVRQENRIRRRDRGSESLAPVTEG